MPPRDVAKNLVKLVLSKLARRLNAAVGEPGFFPNGHYYSPAPDLDDIRTRALEIFTAPDAVPAVELRGAEQLELLRKLVLFYEDQPFSAQRSSERRYYFDNDMFGRGDALILFLLIRHLRPERIVEVGAGFSSALILDTNELFFDNSITCTFIEPLADRVDQLLRPGDTERHRFIKKPIQAAGLRPFDELAKGDILFIDSSHVAKVGSDVNHLIFEILPRLKEGVVIHFHDIFYPFEYPAEWVYEGRAWNEAYLLHAFLMNNPCYRIMWWNSYLGYAHADALARALPLWSKHSAGSVWIEKTEVPAGV